MSHPYIGGRNRQAPYETTHCRIPAEIKPLVELLSNSFKSLVAAVGKEKALKILEPPVSRVIEFGETKNLPNQQKAIAILTEALTYKANAGGKIKAAIKEAIAALNDEE